jgi:hypothetical protein
VTNPIITIIAKVGRYAGKINDAGHCEVVGYACPCGAYPTFVVGSGKHIAACDRAYEATGYCRDCVAPIGTIRAEVSTLFGLHEDEAVLLHGRPRVY